MNETSLLRYVLQSTAGLIDIKYDEICKNKKTT